MTTLFVNFKFKGSGQDTQNRYEAGEVKNMFHCLLIWRNACLKFS